MSTIAPTPIDVWYQEQDRAVDEMFKQLKRNRRGRLNQDELKRRVAERAKDIPGDFAEVLARVEVIGEMRDELEARKAAREAARRKRQEEA